MTAFAIVAVAWLATVVATDVTVTRMQSRLMRALQQRHPTLWTELGEPSVAQPFPDSVRANHALRRFVWRDGGKSLDDPAIVRLCNWIRVGYFGILLYSIVCIALVFVGLGW